MQVAPTELETEAARCLGIAILDLMISMEQGRLQRQPKPTAEMSPPVAPSRPETPQPAPPKLLSAREAAKALSLSERTLWQRTSPHGPIPAVRIGRLVRYVPSDLDEWIRKNSR